MQGSMQGSRQIDPLATPKAKPKKGFIFRDDGQRLFMANGMLVTSKDVDQELHKRPVCLAPEDCPERMGSIVLSHAMRVWNHILTSILIYLYTSLYLIYL
jgi:hypothetical protein